MAEAALSLWFLLSSSSGFPPGLPLKSATTSRWGLSVIAQILPTPCCRGRPRSGVDTHLADTGVAELSQKEVPKGHGGWHGTEPCGLVSRAKARWAAVVWASEGRPSRSCGGLRGFPGHARRGLDFVCLCRMQSVLSVARVC